MATVLLTNKNPDSKYKKARINIATDKCILDEEKEVEREQLSHLGFEHPLIADKTLQHADSIFHYQYDDIDGLLHTATYVYSTLLHVDNPVACKFKINPSAAFYASYETDSIHFSINSDRFAREIISISQLETIVTNLSDYKFQFLDSVLIDEEFTLNDLPKSIDGDLLYTASSKLVQLLKTPCDLKRFELRYINPFMGFGVFSRALIKKGETIFFYGGVKKISDTHDARYAFDYRLDCLKMYLDAREYGNIARFVNHAPNPNRENSSLSSSLLEANVDSTSNYLYGIEIVFFTANKDIAPGEQLLVDYGDKFFKTAPMRRFKNGGKTSLKNVLNSSPKKLTQLRVMAEQGVKKAQQYLLLRMLAIAVVIIIIMTILASMDFSSLTG